MSDLKIFVNLLEMLEVSIFGACTLLAFVWVQTQINASKVQLDTWLRLSIQARIFLER